MELIQIRTSSSGKRVICARDLHAFLESRQKFTDWIKSRVSDFDFLEGTDFIVHKIMTQYNQIDRIDYFCTVQMAKELSMVERNEKGKQARKYFIECEEQLINQVQHYIPKTYGEALQLAADQTKKLDVLAKQIEANKTHVDFSKSIEASTESILLGNFAKVISKGNFKIGRNRLFAWLRKENIIDGSNMPYQKYIDYRWFEVKESPYLNDGKVKLSFTTMITGKGQIKILKKLRPDT